MLRAAAWTVGLFGAGLLVCGLFSWKWIEPVVLLGLGITFLAVSARTGASRGRARALAPKQAAA